MNHADIYELKHNPAAENGWNQRYVAYAADQGREPTEQLRHDQEVWRGGSMTGFTIWISQRWREWRAAKKRGAHEPLSAEDHNEFDRWISGRGWSLL